MAANTRIIYYADLNERNATEVRKVYELTIAKNFELGGKNSIIKKESATGDGGYVVNNGRLIEQIPVNGTLIGESNSDLKRQARELDDIRLNGYVIEFITKFKKNFNSNKYYIEDLRIFIKEDSYDNADFSMTLTEFKQANVSIRNLNLSTDAVADKAIDIYSGIIEQSDFGTGIISDSFSASISELFQYTIEGLQSIFSSVVGDFADDVLPDAAIEFYTDTKNLLIESPIDFFDALNVSKEGNVNFDSEVWRKNNSLVAIAKAIMNDIKIPVPEFVRTTLDSGE